MRGSWVSVCTMFLACLALVGAAICVRGEEPAKKYLGMVRHGDFEVEKEFNLADAHEMAELNEYLQEGKIDSLKAEKPPKILDISYDLGLWTIVVFGLLLYVLRKLAWTPWLKATERREQAIRGALEEAQRAREEAQRLRDQLQSEMAQAASKVRDLLDEARRDAQRAKEELLAEARSENQRERERLHREIGMAQDQALQELWNQAAQLATLISAKAIRRQLTIEDHRRLVDEALQDLHQVGNERQRQVVSVQ